MTQEKLAEVSGVALRTIRNIETRRIAAPRPSTVGLLANALGLHGAERDRFHESALLGGDEQAGVPDARRTEYATMSGDVMAGSLRRVRPRQLPAPPRMFTGRTREVSELGNIHDSSTVVITAIDGMAGVGKTALAAYAGHRIADRYPDGQLFIDLHGFTEAVAPVEPGNALDRLLRALGLAGEQIPVGLEDRAGLWRSVLAERRMLIVLDNAISGAQVAPLLPGS